MKVITIEEHITSEKLLEESKKYQSTETGDKGNKSFLEVILLSEIF